VRSTGGAPARLVSCPTGGHVRIIQAAEVMAGIDGFPRGA
jgi:hypothetical protein